jgi:hypothetical protein
MTHRCDHCGGPLGLIVHRYYQMRFCCEAHAEAYRRRLTEDTRAKVGHLDHARPVASTRPSSGALKSII